MSKAASPIGPIPILVFVTIGLFGLWPHLMFSAEVGQWTYFKSAYDEDFYALTAAAGAVGSFYRLISVIALEGLTALTNGNVAGALIWADGILPGLCAVAGYWLAGHLSERPAVRILLMLLLLFGGDLVSGGSTVVWAGSWNVSWLRTGLPHGDILVPDYATSYLGLFRTPEPQCAWIVFLLAQGLLLSILARLDRSEKPAIVHWVALGLLNGLMMLTYVFVSLAGFFLLASIAFVMVLRSDYAFAFALLTTLLAPLILATAYYLSSSSMQFSGSLLFRSRLPEITPAVILSLVLSSIWLVTLIKNGRWGYVAAYGAIAGLFPLFIMNQQMVSGLMVSGKEWERNINYSLLFLSAALLLHSSGGKLGVRTVSARAVALTIVLISSVLAFAMYRTYAVWFPQNELSVAISNALLGIPAEQRSRLPIVLEDAQLAPLVRLRLQERVTMVGDFSELFPRPVPSLTERGIDEHLADNVHRYALYEYLFRTERSPDYLRARLDQNIGAKSGYHIAFFFSFLDHWYPASDARKVRTEDMRRAVPAIVAEYASLLESPPEDWLRPALLVTTSDEQADSNLRHRRELLSEVSAGKTTVRVFRQDRVGSS